MSASQLFLEYMLRASKYALILLSLAIIMDAVKPISLPSFHRIIAKRVSQ